MGCSGGKTSKPVAPDNKVNDAKKMDEIYWNVIEELDRLRDKHQEVLEGLDQELQSVNARISLLKGADDKEEAKAEISKRQTIENSIRENKNSLEMIVQIKTAVIEKRKNMILMQQLKDLNTIQAFQKKLDIVPDKTPLSLAAVEE